MKKYINVIRQSALFKGISIEEIEDLIKSLNFEIIKYDKNEFVLREGDIVNSIGLVLKGSLLIIHEDFWGNRNLINRVNPTQCFAEAFACTPKEPMAVSVISDTSSEVFWLKVPKLLEKHSENCSYCSTIINNLVSNIATKAIQFNEKLSHIAQRTTRNKLLSYLSAQAKKNGNNEFDISFNRQQLADYLSVERSAMSKELSKLKKQGIIDYDKNHFKLTTVVNM